MLKKITFCSLRIALFTQKNKGCINIRLTPALFSFITVKWPVALHSWYMAWHCGISALFWDIPHYNKPKGSQGCEEGKITYYET